MPNGYELYLKYKLETREIELRFYKLILRLIKRDREKAEEILNRITDPDDPLTVEEAIKIIREMLE